MIRSVEPWLWATCITLLLASTIVAGDPILGPDLSSCHSIIPHEVYLSAEKETFTCCILDKVNDTDRPIVDFKYPQDGAMRVRRPIHTLDDAYIEKYKRAYEIMRSLPPTDPRSYEAQSNLHCAYATESYNQFNSTAPLRVHDGWLSIPFHRWYLYFHERILGSLIGDDTFALPYWAWDVQYETSPPANTIPSMFLSPGSSLYDPRRSAIHMPPHRADLSIPCVENRTDLKSLNVFNMWRVMIGEAKTPESFYGGKYSKGDIPFRQGGQFDTGPHGAVHTWTGNEQLGMLEDMGPSYTSAKDPIFFAHHSQADRLWLLYQEKGGLNFDNPDWLDAEFLFYDLNAEFVRVRIRDCLELEKLGITYEQVPADWVDHVPQSLRETDFRFERKPSGIGGILRKLWRLFLPMLDRVEIPLLTLKDWSGVEQSVLSMSEKEVVSRRVRRPDTTLRTTMGAHVLDEVLVIEGTVTKPFHSKAQVLIFLELPEADVNTPRDCAEALGNLYFEAEVRRNGTMVTTRFAQKIGISSRYSLLGIKESASVTITLVPAWDDKDVMVHVTNLNLELHVA